MQEREIMFAWSKSLLSVYKYLDTVISAIDNLVLKQGKSWGGNFRNYYNSTYNCANKIIELTERKRRLLHVRILIDDCVASLPQNDIRILVLSFFDKLKCSTVAETMKVSLRTYFRMKKTAITKFSNALKRFGFNSEKLAEYLKDEEWLMAQFHKNFEAEKQQNSELQIDMESKIQEFKLLKYIIKDLNKTTAKTYSYRY